MSIRDYDFRAKRGYEVALTPAELVTPRQLASLKRHQRNGTSPGNPKWYRPQVIKPFEPQLSQRFPHLGTGADWFTKHHSQHRKCPIEAAIQALRNDAKAGAADYIAAFEAAANLRPVGVAVAEPAVLKIKYRKYRKPRMTKAQAEQFLADHVAVVRVGEKVAA